MGVIFVFLLKIGVSVNPPCCLQDTCVRGKAPGIYFSVCFRGY